MRASFREYGCFCANHDGKKLECFLPRDRRLMLILILLTFGWFFAAIVTMTTFSIPQQGEIESANCTIIDCVWTSSATYYYLQYLNITSTTQQSTSDTSYCISSKVTTCYFFPWKIADTLSDSQATMLVQLYSGIPLMFFFGYLFLMFTIGQCRFEYV